MATVPGLAKIASDGLPVIQGTERSHHSGAPLVGKGKARRLLKGRYVVGRQRIQVANPIEMIDQVG